VPDPRDPAIPVIALFAGPGRLGEGFSRHATHNRPAFRIALSIERNAAARRTRRPA
jgi:DNA (cytosine-5)-methyltransferase 1